MFLIPNLLAEYTNYFQDKSNSKNNTDLKMGGKDRETKDIEDKDKKVECTTFEPQAWRRNLCKNCFKTKPEHNKVDLPPSKDEDPQISSAKTSDDATGEESNKATPNTSLNKSHENKKKIKSKTDKKAIDSEDAFNQAIHTSAVGGNDVSSKNNGTVKDNVLKYKQSDKKSSTSDDDIAIKHKIESKYVKADEEKRILSKDNKDNRSLGIKKDSKHGKSVDKHDMKKDSKQGKSVDKHDNKVLTQKHEKDTDNNSKAPTLPHKANVITESTTDISKRETTTKPTCDLSQISSNKATTKSKNNIKNYASLNQHGKLSATDDHKQIANGKNKLPIFPHSPGSLTVEKEKPPGGLDADLLRSTDDKCLQFTDKNTPHHSSSVSRSEGISNTKPIDECDSLYTDSKSQETGCNTKIYSTNNDIAKKQNIGYVATHTSPYDVSNTTVAPNNLAATAANTSSHIEQQKHENILQQAREALLESNNNIDADSNGNNTTYTNIRNNVVVDDNGDKHTQYINIKEPEQNLDLQSSEVKDQYKLTDPDCGSVFPSSSSLPPLQPPPPGKRSRSKESEHDDLELKEQKTQNTEEIDREIKNSVDDQQHKNFYSSDTKSHRKINVDDNDDDLFITSITGNNSDSSAKSNDSDSNTVSQKRTRTKVNQSGINAEHPNNTLTDYYDDDEYEEYQKQLLLEEEEEANKARLLKESLTDITDVFDAPLSPRALDKYRKELFDSDGNIASPKSPYLVDNTDENNQNHHVTSGVNGEQQQLQQGDNNQNIFYHSPEADRYVTNYGNKDIFDFEQGQQTSLAVLNQDIIAGGGQRGGKSSRRNRRRRSRGDLDDWEMASHHSSSRSIDPHLSREEAMMEGTRMLMDNLREKIIILEDKVEKVEREKSALGELLSVKKNEYIQMKDHYKDEIHDCEDAVKRLSAEKERLVERLKLPESERGSLRETEREISKLNKKLDDAEQHYLEAMDENMYLKQEVKDLQTEIDEMHDQFREDEQIEFRELQRELEMNAKNCRILQFKLRKAERRNEQLEADKIQFEDKIRQLETRFAGGDEKQQIRELEEELKMAKEVSVRLHDELELVEEKRGRYEEELDRINDILTDSENRRTSLQKEIDNLRNEVESYRRGNKGKAAPTLPKETLTLHRPPLEKQGSSEYDLKEVMRNLQDSLERENDIKEQLEFRDEEIRTLKRRLSDFEEENESINLQLQKMSSAKSGKYFKKAGDVLEREIVTEREHELRLQMELAEQELKVLRRKMDEMDILNETLIKELKKVERELRSELSGDRKKDNGKSDEEKIRCMAEDIERLKFSLIEKDQEADRQRRSKTKLKKSRSLEEESTYEENSEYHIDLRRQLETIQQEAEVLKDKITSLEQENQRLYNENRKFETGKKSVAGGKGGGKIPSVTTDDAAIQNIELKDKLKALESQNSKLRDQIKSLDDKTSQLSHDVTRTLSRSHSESYDVIESRGLRSKLKTYEEECNQLKKKISDLEARNAKLTEELDSKKVKKSKKDAKKEKDKEKEKEVSKMSKHDLASKIVYMEEEIKDLRQAISNREEQNTRLEQEIDEYREDMDKMFSSFKMREQELIEEMESLQNKNNVISNLLDIVTERAESAQKELYRSVREASRSPSQMSDLSGVSAGSDEVFADNKDKIIEERLEEQFMKKIQWLERNLAEEKHKVQTAERKLDLMGENDSSSKEEKKLQVKEKEILQQEVTVAQNQLKDANKKVKDLKSKLEKFTKDSESLKELEEKQKQQETLIKKLKEELDKEEKAKSKKSATWIWEKQNMEADLKEQKKKVEELHAEVKRQQFKWKMAGEDIEREQKLKLQMQEQLESLKKEAMRHTIDLDKMKTELQKAEDKYKIRQTEWEKEKKDMEKVQKQGDKEISNKDEIIKQKDEIITQKEDLIKKKTSVLSEREDKIKKYETELQTHATEMEQKSSKLLQQEKELLDINDNVKDLLSQVKEKDKKIKTVSEDLRKRDDRLQEKDDILQKLNRKLADRENEVKDMDQTIRQAMKKLQDRESELKTTEKTCKEFETQAAQFRTSTKELKSQISKLDSQQSELTEERNKVMSDLKTIKKEKRALLSELQDTKEKLKDENEKLKKDKNKLELDLKQANEKLHSMKATSHMKESEVIKTLTNEKENLITDKHKINEELKNLRKSLKEDTEKWNIEREDLQKIIAEKTKMVKDNNKICEKIQSEMDKLKQQTAQRSPKLTPIPVHHETTRSVSPAKENDASEELKAKIDRQDFMNKAEKLGLEELYEGKVKNLQEQVDQAQTQVVSLKSENDQQLDLIQSSRVALADLRKRYDTGLVTWNEERDHLLKKIRDLEEKQDKLKTIEKSLEEVKTKLQKEESKKKELENKLASEKINKSADKSSASKFKKDEQPSLARRESSSGVSEFRAKFEKFGGPSKAKSASATKDETADSKAKDEAQKIIKDLQKQIKDLEKTRETDRQDLLGKINDNENEWKKDKKKFNERNKKLEQQCEQLSQLQKSLVDLQYKYHEDQERWSLERNHTHKELEDTKILYLQEKGHINDLLAEIKKLQSITKKSGAESADSTTSSKDLKSRTKIVVAKPEEVRKITTTSSDEHITEYIQEVLQRISELAETCEKALPLRTSDKSSNVPPAFRRSLSTTEVELGLDSYLESSTYASQYSSLTSNKDPTSRLRQYRRSNTDTEDYETKTIDRHLRGRTTDKQRTSKYFSGTRSAYGSRDTSPDKNKLPKAPPSMIISPSQTPRRAKSKDRKTLSKKDMSQLYEKLGEIEYEEQEQNKALITERGRGIRVLTKSLSVDNPHDEISSVVPAEDQVEESTSRVSKTSVGKRFATIAKIHSKTYEDAPLSHTLLASIRIGELSITPGVEELTTKIRKLSKKRSDSVSPHTARKTFFDSYSFSPKSYFPWSKKKERTTSVDSNDSVSQERVSVRYESESEAETEYSKNDEEGQARLSLKDRSKKKSKFSFFGKKDKDKRDRSSSTDSKQKKRLFSFKRSSSVENSPVHSTVVNAGMSTLIGAPSTYEAPDVQIVEPQHTPSTTATSLFRQSRKLSQHHRAASVDASVITAVNTSDKSHSDLVASLIAQREAIAQKDSFSSSSSTTFSSQKSAFFGRRY